MTDHVGTDPRPTSHNSGVTRCLLVNGLPATGKTTVCRELQRLRHERGELWLHVPLDVHQAMLPENVTLTDEQYRIGVGAMYRSIEALASSANVILELVVRDDPSVREIYTGIRSALARAGGATALVTLTCDVSMRRVRAAGRPTTVDGTAFVGHLDPVTVERSELVLSVDDLDAAAIALRLCDLLDA